jgi:lysozyme
MSDHGLDFSHYQGTIDWNAVRKSGLTYAIGKTTEGLHPDPSWATNRTNALTAGMHLSGYHWAHPNLDPGACATAFASALQQNDQMMLPFIDVEHNGNPSANPTAAGGVSGQHIHDWIHAFAAAYGHPIGIYTGGWFWNVFVAAANCAECAARPLWLSRYATTMGPIPKPWKKVAVWQYTETGRSAGVAGNVDLDVTVDTPLAALLALTQPTPLAPEDDMAAADVAAINQHIDHAVDEIRTETGNGNSIANVRMHQDSQGNQIQALQADVDGIKAQLATILAAVGKA